MARTASRVDTSVSIEEPFWDLVEESLDEAAFLWTRWEGELDSITRNFDAVWTWTEDRLQGALDGVRLGGDTVAERLLEPALAKDDPAMWTVCAHLLAARSPPSCRAILSGVLREAKGPRLEALVRGIEVAELDASFVSVTTTLLTAGEEHKAALCRIKAFRRAAPGLELAELLRSADAGVRINALRAAAIASGPSFDAPVLDALRAAAPVKSAAIEAGIRRRLPAAWASAVDLAHARPPEAAPFLGLLAMLGGADEHELVYAALREPALQVAGVRALAHIGTSRAAETCIAAMGEPKLARSAGASYCAITGADLERDRLSAEEADSDTPVSFEADDLDANLVPNADDLWPTPDPEAVRRHWQESKVRHAAGTRHVRGEPVTLRVLRAAIETGPMHERPDHILELAVRTNGQYDVEPRAFSTVQRRMLAAGASRVA
jgi:uncharacterized protein (TIGR02270 family)